MEQEAPITKFPDAVFDLVISKFLGGEILHALVSLSLSCKKMNNYIKNRGNLGVESCDVHTIWTEFKAERVSEFSPLFFMMKNSV